MVTASVPSIGRARDGLERLWQWWLAEFKGLLPATLRRSAGSTAHRAGLLLQGDQITLLHLPPRGGAVTVGCFDTGEQGLADLKARLADLRRADSKLVVGLIVLKGQCLERYALMPRAARKDLDAILKLEIENTTPFAADAIYWDYEALPNPAKPELLEVRYLVAHRSIIDVAKQSLGQAGLTVGFAAVLDNATDALLGHDLLRLSRPQTGAAGHSWLNFPILIGAAALLACFFSYLDQQSEALRRLDQEISAQRRIVADQHASSKRELNRAASISELAVLRNRAPRLADVWLALTRALPDTAWASDLRLNGDDVEISGYAASAASLVDVLAGAPEWVDVNFKAPIIMDERVGKQHFVLGLRLKSAPPKAQSREAP